jgi:hypothetical protein
MEKKYFNFKNEESTDSKAKNKTNFPQPIFCTAAYLKLRK